jgi:hypothetical protein
LRTSRQALLRYAAIWLLGGIAVALFLVLLLRGGDEIRKHRRADPLRAVVASGCVLEDPHGRSAHVTEPPVGGPPARPTAAGSYTSPQPRDRLVGALRRGAVVIQYEPRLDAADVAALERSFARDGRKLILAPDGTGMTFRVAATAWGRLLGCSKVNGTVLRALRTFAARYEGSGPDARDG